MLAIPVNQDRAMYRFPAYGREGDPTEDWFAFMVRLHMQSSCFGEAREAETSGIGCLEYYDNFKVFHFKASVTFMPLTDHAVEAVKTALRCQGCDHHRATVKPYRLTHHDDTQTAVRYCDGCAMLAEADYNGTTQAIVPAFDRSAYDRACNVMCDGEATTLVMASDRTGL